MARSGRGSLDDDAVNPIRGKSHLPRKKRSQLSDVEDPSCLSDSECTPLIERGSSRETIGFSDAQMRGIARMSKWTREMNMGKSKWWVLVVSAFANIGPGGCLVVSNPERSMVATLITMMIFLGLSLFGAYMSAQAMTISGTWTMASCWRGVFGPRTAWVPLLTISITCFSCAVGYAELASHMISTVWFWTPIPTLLERPDEFWTVLLGVFPLSILVCLKDISLMKPATTITMLSCTFTLAAVFTRFVDGSYAPQGRWFEFRQSSHYMQHAGESIFFERKEMPLRLFTSQAVLFLCHFNAGKYYSELENPKTDRFTAGIGIAMAFSFACCSGIIIFTTLTFGYRIAGLTLDNYAPDDPLINTARIATSLGIMGCYPLLFCGMREAVIEFLSDIMPKSKGVFETVVFQNSFSLVMLAVSILIELRSSRFSLFLLRLGRTCFGSLLIYTIPVMLFVGTRRKHLTNWDMGVMKSVLLFILFSFGIAISVIAAWSWISYGVD